MLHYLPKFMLTENCMAAAHTIMGWSFASGVLLGAVFAVAVVFLWKQDEPRTP